MYKFDVLGFQPEELFEQFVNKKFLVLKDNLFFRNIKYQNMKILKLVSFLVRDKNWNNYEPSIIKSDSKIINDNINFEFNLKYGDIEKLEVKINVIIGNDSLKFIANGKFLTDFWTNRIGFNLLLPLDGVVGQNVEVVKADKTVKLSSFPSLISPDQPMLKFNKLSYKMFDTIDVRIIFKGANFEMEDQRNWGDASYKIYSGSLLDPFPYKEKEHSIFYQEIELFIEEKNKISSEITNNNSLFPEMTEEFQMPQIGIKLEKYKKIEGYLNFDFFYYIVDFDNKTHLSEERFLNKPVYIVALIDHKKNIKDVMNEIKDYVESKNIQLNKLLICPKVYLNSFQPAGKWPDVPNLSQYYKLAKSYFPNVKIFGGMVTNFTELNRKKPDGNYDGINFSFTPIVHDASDMGVLDTPNSIPFMLNTIKKFAKDTPIHIGPITLGMHYNPYGEKLANNTERKRLEMAEIDPRHDSLISLNWSVAMLSQIISKNTKYITYASLTGVHGIFDQKNKKRPLFYFYEILSILKNTKVYKIKRLNYVYGLLILKEKKMYYLLANTSSIEQQCYLNHNFCVKESYLNKKNFDQLNNGNFSFFNFKKTTSNLIFQPLEIKLIEVTQ